MGCDGNCLCPRRSQLLVELSPTSEESIGIPEYGSLRWLPLGAGVSLLGDSRAAAARRVLLCRQDIAPQSAAPVDSHGLRRHRPGVDRRGFPGSTGNRERALPEGLFGGSARNVVVSARGLAQ